MKHAVTAILCAILCFTPKSAFAGSAGWFKITRISNGITEPNFYILHFDNLNNTDTCSSYDNQLVIWDDEESSNNSYELTVKLAYSAFLAGKDVYVTWDGCTTSYAYGDLTRIQVCVDESSCGQ